MTEKEFLKACKIAEGSYTAELVTSKAKEAGAKFDSPGGEHLVALSPVQLGGLLIGEQHILTLADGTKLRLCFNPGKVG